ncbi:MAG: bifunctional phosphopantothenoylcysteine decarboxylase/phosphopantothenate--cysteine ligase CoaBC [Planctomycetales bacterium]|nr:bifunctional phosphopantothenoylcysteine decarboxylase/phosphopantothenate--cysteine ligase CoaBC [bacterium]UNM09825.1 MAG: bifunctional phosphopantothenoylcysteine decarboxylase/phosphopantothenate--cysteine ligase CoaBC [Planctomycetales bacterium]
MSAGKRILLGVSGGIAAYRACELTRLFVHSGCEVQVVLTPAAEQFVSAMTFTALSGRRALVTDDYDGGSEELYAHLNLTRGIDCMVVAPATADCIADMAHGRADRLLTACHLSNTAPLVVAPAMNVRMWEHPAVQANVRLLRERRAHVIGPASGSLACGDVGSGRMSEPEEIHDFVFDVIASTPSDFSSGELAGRHIIVTAGGTREYIDPVRYITNASTGTLGLEIAAALLDAGATVELLETGIELRPEMLERLSEVTRVRTAYDLQGELARRLPDADGLVMLAAVADYGPAQYISSKRKKDGDSWMLALSETPDVLASMQQLRRPDQVICGVSLEDSDWLERAKDKARRKGADMLLAVELGGDLPFGRSKLNCAMVTGDSVIAEPGWREKHELAALTAQWIAGRLGEAGAGH